MIIDATFRTITCDGPGCTRTVTFDRKHEREELEKPENAWLKSTRMVQRGDGHAVAYCSDICEVKGAGTGSHNIPEPTKIQTATNPAAIAAAAQAAAAAREAETAIRNGQPANIKLTD